MAFALQQLLCQLSVDVIVLDHKHVQVCEFRFRIAGLWGRWLPPVFHGEP
eukprot:CAMPEP_0184465188 /NCGR_PEP_ID=MMETSP0740-20130409/60634_1 /TAXON_ID=385413 /ORGANISM="Thalassiosira miniscula, Strain CCMP1093" /LENGTH=49 /DNA_ID= /DNA_START= /DNA_END= /DNA_ORIENTATION=